MRAFLALFSIAACGPVRSAPGVVVDERVAVRLVWYDFHQVPTRYAISFAMVAPPYYVLLSESGRFCPVSEEVYHLVIEGQPWPCRWHAPRG